MSKILNQYTPEEYAAFWGCDPAYDTPPRQRGDGALFYNFGSEKQERTKEFLAQFAGAIGRTLDGVHQRCSSKPVDLEERLEDLEGLEQLREHVLDLQFSSWPNRGIVVSPS
jgi:hypothetical protein